jgi:hypothetical protein
MSATREDIKRRLALDHNAQRDYRDEQGLPRPPTAWETKPPPTDWRDKWGRPPPTDWRDKWATPAQMRAQPVDSKREALRARLAGAKPEGPDANFVAREMAARGALNIGLAIPSASGDMLAAAAAVKRYSPETRAFDMLRGVERQRPGFGELFDQEREKFPANMIRKIPRLEYGDLEAGIQAIPALMPGGVSPGEAFARERAEDDAEVAAMREAHPEAASIGDIGGDVASLFLGRKAPGIDSMIQRSETRLAGKAGVHAAKSLLDDLESTIKSAPMQKLARGAGRSVEAGVEAAVLDIAKDPDADPLEIAAIAAGGQMVGSGAIGAVQGITSGGLTQAGLKMSLLAASSFGLIQVMKSAAPGGQDRILESIETGYDKVALALGLGAASAALAATRYGRGNTNLSNQTRTFLDGVATAHRGTVLHFLTQYSDGTPEEKRTMERVMMAVARDPEYQGETASEKRFVRQLRIGDKHVTGGGF